MTTEYHIAVFTPDGALHGTSVWRYQDLSPGWMAKCTALLESAGLSFRQALGAPLDHLEVKLTATPAVGLATFHARSQLALSSLYLAGLAPEQEREVSAMFLESVRRTPLLEQHGVGQPFLELPGLTERPLHVVVAWFNPGVSDADYVQLRDFSTHVAAAFFHLSAGEA